MISPNRRQGLSLVELMAFIILFGTIVILAMRFSSAQQASLRTAEENTIALFALESARNQVLAHVESGREFAGDSARDLNRSFLLPHGMMVQATLGSPPAESTGTQTQGVASTTRFVTVAVDIPARGRPRPRRFERKVIVP